MLEVQQKSSQMMETGTVGISNSKKKKKKSSEKETKRGIAFKYTHNT